MARLVGGGRRGLGGGHAGVRFATTGESERENGKETKDEESFHGWEI
jgi:hypothetical protein